MSSRIAAIVIAFGLLPGCAEDESADTQFVSDSYYDEGFSCIEFTDGHTVNIECIRLDKEGRSDVLWEEVLEPHADGLGNTMFILAGSELKILGRGRKPFAHSIADFELGKIDHFTRGRNASLGPANIVWVCMLKGSSEAILPDAIPTLPQDLEEIAAVSRRFSAEAIVLRASHASTSEQK